MEWFSSYWKTINKGPVSGVSRLLGYQFSQGLHRDLFNIDLSAAELNIDLESTKFWAKIWKNDFNPLKSKSLLITKMNQNIQHPPLIMSQSQIEEVKEHKNLSITFC